MKKKTKGSSGKKGEKEKRRECSAESVACGSSSSRSDCAWCGATEGSIPGIMKHFLCGRCKAVSYCGEECQKKHWKEGGHKQNCVAPADRKASTALTALGAERMKNNETLGDGKASADDENNDECAMCLENLTSAKVLTLPCSHVYLSLIHI